MNDWLWIPMMAVAVILVSALGAVLVGNSSTPNRVLLERGIIQYCPDTGEIAFTGECEDK